MISFGGPRPLKRVLRNAFATIPWRLVHAKRCILWSKIIEHEQTFTSYQFVPKNYYYLNLKKRKFFIDVLELDYIFPLSNILCLGLVYLSFCASYLRVLVIRIKFTQRNGRARVTCTNEIFIFDFHLDPWWFWRLYHNQSQLVLYFSLQTLRNSSIKTMKTDRMCRTMSDCSW